MLGMDQEWTMTLDKFDMLLDAINQVRSSVDAMAQTQIRQSNMCDCQFLRLEKEASYLRVRVYAIAIILIILASLHKIDLTKLLAGI